MAESPVCLFCTFPSSDSLFITQAHQLPVRETPASDQLRPVQPGNHLCKHVPLSSYCLSGNTWEIFCSVYPKTLCCTKKCTIFKRSLQWQAVWVKFTLLPVLRRASEGEMQMLRSFDQKQNVNSHAFNKIAFLPKTFNNEGKEEVTKKSTEQ